MGPSLSPTSYLLCPLFLALSTIPEIWLFFCFSRDDVDALNIPLEGELIGRNKSIFIT